MLRELSFAGLVFALTTSDVTANCESRISSFRQITIQKDGQSKEYRLSSPEDRINFDNVFSFHGVTANFHCSNCFGYKDVGGAFRLIARPEFNRLTKWLERGENFTEFAMNVYGTTPPLGEAIVRSSLKVGELLGEFTGFALGPDKEGLLGSVINFYASDDCITLIGIAQAFPAPPGPVSFGALREIAEELRVTEVELGSTSKEVSVPSKPPPVTVLNKRFLPKPFSLEDLKPFLENR